jgi:septation ring formation regulator EzrA
MKGYSFIASVYVLRSVLPILSSLSKVFQSGTIDFSHICPSLQYTIDKLKEIADNQTPIVELKKDLSERGRSTYTDAINEYPFILCKNS